MSDRPPRPSVGTPGRPSWAKVASYLLVLDITWLVVIAPIEAVDGVGCLVMAGALIGLLHADPPLGRPHRIGLTWCVLITSAVAGIELFDPSFTHVPFPVFVVLLLGVLVGIHAFDRAMAELARVTGATRLARTWTAIGWWRMGLSILFVAIMVAAGSSSSALSGTVPSHMVSGAVAVPLALALLFALVVGLLWPALALFRLWQHVSTLVPPTR